MRQSSYMEDLAMNNLLLDTNTTQKVRKYIPKKEVLSGLADFFSIFSDATRMKIISALTITEMCVTDISEILGINQTTVSHQLKIMRQAGVVGFRREGKILFYFVTSPIVENVMLNGVVYLGY